MKNLVEIIKRKASLGLVLIGTTSLILTGCSKEEVMSQRENASFYATDAPIDNAEVKAVFVTVADIRVDGKSIEGFQKTTLEVSALTEGKTQLLKNAELEADAISEITVVMDYDLDASGNSPGSYILKVDGTKEAIASNATELSFTKNLALNGGSDNDIVIDFDLRKMIREEAKGDFELVSSAELESSIRVVSAGTTGSVEGKLDSVSKIKGKAVAYLYAEGSFNNAEIMGQGESKIEFMNAINSAVVAEDGSFKIAFTEEGDYEIHIFEYDDVDNDGEMEIKGKIVLNTTGSADAGGFTVGANSKTDLNVGVKSIFPL